MSSISGGGSPGPQASRPAVLVYGYGNPGRQDDGAGVALADALERWAGSAGRPWLTFERNYQLNVEDALEALRHRIVVFLDATADQEEPFRFLSLQPSSRPTFTTHQMRPESVLALCRDLYGSCPFGRLLTIRGYSWEPGQAMTEQPSATWKPPARGWCRGWRTRGGC